MTLDILVSGAGNTIINGVEMSFAGKDTSGQEVWESPDGGYYYGNGTYLGTTFNPATGGMSGSGNASGSLNGSGGGLSGSGTGNGSGSTAADTASSSSGNPAGGNAGSQQGESNPFEVTPVDVAGGAYSTFTATLGYYASRVEESAATYRYAADIPLATPLIMIDAGLAYQQNGPGAALSALLGDTAGYVATSAFMDSTIAEAAIVGIAAAGFPEVVAVAGVALVGVIGGAIISKGVQYLVNNLENQTATQNSSGQTVYPDGTTVSTLANGDTQYALSNGTTYTVNPGTGTSTISVNGDTYSFDAANNVTGVSLNNNSFNMQVAANGTATVTDSTGAVTSVSFGTDANGNPTATATNPQGQSSSMTLGTDSNGNAVATSGDISSTTLVDPDTGNLTTTVTQGGQTVEQVQYGADGSAAQSFYDPTTGALTRQNQIAPDGSQVNDVVNADGSQTITALNAAGQKTEQDQLNADGSQVVDSYNPATGALTGENQVNADGSQTDYTINADGSQTATALNAAGQKTEQVQFNTDGSQVQDYYNPGTGALTGENQIAADGSQTDYTINADGSQTATVLNPAGQKTEQVQFNADGSQVQDSYNPATGALTSENQIAADGSQTDYTINADGSQTATALNAAGQKTEQVQFNADGSQVQDFYNPSTGALTGENQINADGSQTDIALNADGSQTATQLNAAGQETGQEQFNTDGSKVLDSYNPATGALTGENQINADGSQTDYVLNADGSQTATQLNAAGQETEQVQFNADGSQIRDSYNPATGALTSEDQTAADGSQTDVSINDDGSQTTVAYNAAGQVTEAAQLEPDGSETLVNYDPATGQATSETDLSADGSQIDYTINANGNETAAWYNASGNETQYASVDGNETDVLTFLPGAAYATQMNVYENGGLVEVDNWNGTSGALQDVLLYDGGAYPYEVEEASNDGSYFSQIEQVDPDTGDVLGTASFNASGLVGTSGDYSGGYDDSDDDQVADSSGGDDDMGDDSDSDFGFAGSQQVIDATLASGANPILASGAQAQARQSADGSAGQASVDEGATWGGKKLITWSLSADDSGDAAQQAAEKAAAQQAFAAWSAAVPGLVFEEVDTGANADIHIVWGNLNTAGTGVVGYTSLESKNGQITGAQIQLEAPANSALVPDGDGQLDYSGTNATLQQVLEHEIGHALGLADTSDPDSVMYYELTPANRTLNATDVQGIQALYGAQTAGAGSNALAGAAGAAATDAAATTGTGTIAPPTTAPAIPDIHTQRRTTALTIASIASWLGAAHAIASFASTTTSTSAASSAATLNSLIQAMSAFAATSASAVTSPVSQAASPIHPLAVSAHS